MHCHYVFSIAALSKDICLHWCLDNNFELVELDPEAEDVDSNGGLLSGYFN